MGVWRRHGSLKVIDVAFYMSSPLWITLWCRKRSYVATKTKGEGEHLDPEIDEFWHLFGAEFLARHGPDPAPFPPSRLPVMWWKINPNFLNLILFLNFTIFYWFCQIAKWIHHRYTCVPHPEPSSLLPPRTITLGRPSAPSPSIQYRASNLDWRLVSYMILYVFQCYSPKSSHPLPLPQSPKDCSIHQCLFCCLIYRVIVSIFLNSIYMP